MAVLRRLLIKYSRIDASVENDSFIQLTKEENHYLSKVLRCRKNDRLHICDGRGHLWLAEFSHNGTVKLLSNFELPIQNQKKIFPLICVAVAVPKQGFDDAIKMSCEIGNDVIQPIVS